MNGRQVGLTLLEVMIATMILGAGLVAVASLFPVAGALQRKTYDDVVVRQVGDSVDDLMKARPIIFADTISTGNPLDALSFDVRVVPQKVLGNPSPAPIEPVLVKYGLADRCYPSAMDSDPNATNRSYYWVPLIRRVSLIDFQTYVFVLKKEQGVDYGSHAETAMTGTPAQVANSLDPTAVPIVRSVKAKSVGPGDVDINGNAYGVIANRLIITNASGLFEIGDMVLDSQGVTHIVTYVGVKSVILDGYVSPLVTAIWYSPRPPGGDSPTRKILSFVNGAIVP